MLSVLDVQIPVVCSFVSKHIISLYVGLDVGYFLYVTEQCLPVYVCAFLSCVSVIVNVNVHLRAYVRACAGDCVCTCIPGICL